MVGEKDTTNGSLILGVSDPEIDKIKHEQLLKQVADQKSAEAQIKADLNNHRLLNRVIGRVGGILGR